MKILNPQGTKWYTVGNLRLNAHNYNTFKVRPGTIRYMEDELGYCTTDVIYDLAMNTFCELGYNDPGHETILKIFEKFYARPLTYKELVEYAEAWDDYQN